MALMCPSCQAMVELSEDCSRCGFPLQCRTVTLLPPKRVGQKIPIRAEIGITIDRTGSSRAFAQGIFRSVPEILHGVARKAAEVRVFLQSHGDLDEGQDTILHSDGVSLEQACCDLNSITFGGGGDPAEHHCDAIENLVTSIPWTADSGVARGVVIAFMTATSKKAKSGYSAEQIGWMLKDQGLLTYLVCEPICRRLDALAAEANAMVIPISNDPSPELMAEIVSQISASIVQTLATGGTAPMPV